MRKTTNILLKRNRIIKILKEAVKSKITFLSAPIGCGKTVAVKQFDSSSKYKFKWLDCSKKEEIKKINTIDTKRIILENFNKLEENEKNKIINFIDSCDSSFHFIIISRKPVEKKLKKYFYESDLVEIYKEDLAFTEEEAKMLYELNKINLSTNDFNEMYKDIQGLAIVTNLLIIYLKEGKYNKNIYKMAEEDFFEYINYNIFKDFEPKIMEILIKISFLKTINTTTVNYILDIENGHELLDLIKSNGSFLLKTSNGDYELLDILRVFLQKKAQNEFPINKIRQINLKIAKYYEEEDKNLIFASQYYILTKSYEKAADILQKEAIQHLGIIDYKEIEKYVIEIPENIIEKYPRLCISLANVYRMNNKKEQEKKWFEKFKKIKENYDKKAKEYTSLEQMEIYYKICKPEVNDIKLVDLIKLLSKNRCEDSPISDITFTGNQPSMLNGGKDLSNWTKHYKTLDILLKPMVLSIFKEKQEGAAEIAIAEFLYQKNEIENSIEYIMKANSLSNNIDNLFAVNSLLDKINLTRNNPNNTILKKFKKKIGDEKAWYLMNNFNARILEKDMLFCNNYEIKDWVENANLDIINKFNLLEKYRYFTLARSYISLQNYTEALIVLERLERYADEYNRIIYKIEYYILKSICHFKQNNQEKCFIAIEKSIIEAQKYGYIRVFADEGIIVYNILSENKDKLLENKKINPKFLKQIIKQSEIYGKMYPKKYSLVNVGNDLTKKEKEIIYLICEGKSNKELSEILTISISTVKTHINHIYNKLNIKNRVQIINLVREENILEEFKG